MPATIIVLIAVGAVLAGITLGWSGRHMTPRLMRRASERRFAKEYEALVKGTELDLAELRGPGHGDCAATSPAEPTNDVALLAPKPLSIEDQDYYAASWRNVQGEFSQSPPSGLMLATHLTANLLLNRGLLPADTARPTRLPESWTFPTARGYRDALRISMDKHPAQADLARALGLFEDFYWEMLTLTAATS
jgi:hypothetical protein